MYRYIREFSFLDWIFMWFKNTLINEDMVINVK